jgi:predicted RNase H-like nuclease
MRRITFVGFDSAWSDSPRAPGAICAIRQVGYQFQSVREPHLENFAGALAFIRSVHDPNGLTIVGFDQPTIVPNHTGCRPVERVVGSLVSWLGGGVQPANRSRIGMFDVSAPVWKFLDQLGAIENPELARTDELGLFILEVFPALALASMNGDFFGRLARPRYNPSRKHTFNIEHWIAVAKTASVVAERLECKPVVAWCSDLMNISRPRKSDQDKLDSIICTLVAVCWRLDPRQQMAMIGDLLNGYIVTPVSKLARERLAAAALLRNVPLN